MLNCGLTMPYMNYNYEFGCGCGYNFNNFLSCGIGNLFQTSNYMLGNSIGNLAGGVINGGVNLVGALIFCGIYKGISAIHNNSEVGLEEQLDATKANIDKELAKLGKDATEANYNTKYGTDGQKDELSKLGTDITTANTNLTAAKTELKTAKDEKTRLNTDLLSIKEQIVAAKAAGTDTSELEKNETSIKEAITKQEEIIKAKQEEVNAKQKELDELNNQKKTLEDTTIPNEDEIIAKINDLIAERNDLKTQIDAKKIDKADGLGGLFVSRDKYNEVAKNPTADNVTDAHLRKAAADYRKAMVNGDDTVTTKLKTTFEKLYKAKYPNDGAPKNIETLKKLILE